MVAKKRHFEPGYIYHVLNRGANRQRLFRSASDYDKFEELIIDTLQRTPAEVFTYQLMPTHWHFVLRTCTKEELSEFFQYLAGTHSKRFRVITDSVGDGHVYQDRFKSFPIQSDGHFLVVARYVERNARRAGLVKRAEDWRWGGLWRRLSKLDDWLVSDWPVLRYPNWTEFVNMPLTSSELSAVRCCIRRGCPYGSRAWVKTAADQLGLEHTLRKRGRPRGSLTLA